MTAQGFRIGQGYDSHRLVEGRPLVLAGVTIPHTHGLLGHSDADVLAHAIIDAILGAVGAGDIGAHFPDTDPAYKGADSMELLGRALGIARARGYEVGNLDCTVICEAPKLRPHMDAMHANLRALGIEHVNIKAKTNEGMDAAGRGEGIVAHAVCLMVAVRA
jgi:2-C-methyl-D-erythritol 2,4-cyclodiphosphate synthase